MKKELKQMVETTISTSRHVFSNNTFKDLVKIDPGHIYLLGKIEELEAQVKKLQEYFLKAKSKESK